MVVLYSNQYARMSCGVVSKKLVLQSIVVKEDDIAKFMSTNPEDRPKISRKYDAKEDMKVEMTRNLNSVKRWDGWGYASVLL